MMATRKYKRDSRGRFAGGGAAVTTTVGRAGGFANQPHRERAHKARLTAAQRRRRNTVLKKRVARGTVIALGAALGAGMNSGTPAYSKIAGAIGMGLAANRMTNKIQKRKR